MQAGGGAGWRAAFFNIAALSYYVHKINYEWQTVCFKYGKEKISEFKSLERASVCVCVCVRVCVCVAQSVGRSTKFPHHFVATALVVCVVVFNITYSCSAYNNLDQYKQLTRGATIQLAHGSIHTLILLTVLRAKKSPAFDQLLASCFEWR